MLRVRVRVLGAEKAKLRCSGSPYRGTLASPQLLRGCSP
jgi:hypothetical protein